MTYFRALEVCSRYEKNRSIVAELIHANRRADMKNDASVPFL